MRVTGELPLALQSADCQWEISIAYGVWTSFRFQLSTTVNFDSSALLRLASLDFIFLSGVEKSNAHRRPSGKTNCKLRSRAVHASSSCFRATVETSIVRCSQRQRDNQRHRPGRLQEGTAQIAAGASAEGYLCRAYSRSALSACRSHQNVTVQNQAPAAEAAPAPASSGAPQVTVVQPPPQTIIIQPAQPDVVYVPTYNPTVVYGAPVALDPLTFALVPTLLFFATLIACLVPSIRAAATDPIIALRHE